ncbi:MAG: glycosyltransferase [Deltaproteobacteria bacterium]|nr:glycosyltransferase [Deltaproteobacteria bacterium]
MSNRRVLLIGPFGPGQLPESFARAFERLGYEVFRFDSDRAYFEAGPGPGNRFVRRLLRRVLWERMNRSTCEIIRCVRPRFVLTVKGTYLHAETVARVRRELGVPFVNYYADNPYCGVPWNPRKSSTQRRDLIAVLREYTQVWIWERGMAQRLVTDGVAAGYLPFAVDPEISRPLTPAACAECGTRHEVIFIGQHCEKRQAHIGAVRQHSVALWGSRWQRAAAALNGQARIHQGAVFGADCAALYSSAALALNVVDDLNMPGHNMRTFEITGSGGLMLSTYTAEQAEFFPEDQAALYYREPAEIDDKIERIRGDRPWAARLRKNALALAAGHQYTERAQTIAANL